MSQQAAQVLEAAAWREALAIGQGLLDQPEAAAQQALVVSTTGNLLQGTAALWLDPICQRASSAPAPPHPPLPDSPLMRRALSARRIEFAGEGNAPTCIAAPLLSQQTVLGVLQVARANGRPFSPADVDLFSSIAGQVALGLAVGSQIAAERWYTRQLGLVRSVSAQVAAVLDLSELAERVVGLIVESFGYPYVALYTAEPGGSALRRRASAGAVGPPTSTPDPELVEPGEGLVGRLALDEQEIVYGPGMCWPNSQTSDDLPANTEVAISLRVEGRLLGALHIRSSPAQALGEADLLVLRALADSIAIAVEDAQLASDAKLRAEQLAAIADVSRAVTSILDQDALFAKVVSLIHDRFGFPYVHLFTLDLVEGKIVYRAGSGRRSKALQERGIRYDLDAPRGIIPWVCRQGEAVLANDVDRDPRYVPSELPPAGTRAEMTVPLRFGKSVLGVIDVQSDRKQAFTQGDLALLGTLAASVAIAVRNANLYRAERWRCQVADSLRQVVGLLSANLGLNQVLDAILTHVEQILPCEVAAIWLLQEGNLCLSAVHGASASICVSALSDRTTGWLYQALADERPTLRAPGMAPGPIALALGYPDSYSSIVAPLRIAGRPAVGLLGVAHPETGRYGDEASAICTAFASSAAVAIENTRLYQSAQEKARTATVMLEIARATQALGSLSEVIETVVRLVPTLADAGRCALWLWDAAQQVFTPASSFGLQESEVAEFGMLSVGPADDPVFAQLTTGANEALTSSGTWPVALTIGASAPALFGMRIQGELVGALLVDRRAPDGNASAGALPGSQYVDWVTVVRGIADQAAVAIDSTLLRQGQQEDAYVSAALLQVAQTLAALDDIDAIVSAAVRITPTLVGVARCVLFLWEADASTFGARQAYGVPRDSEAELLAQQYASGEFPLLDLARQQRQPVSGPDSAAAGAPVPPNARQVAPGFLELFTGLAPNQAGRLSAVPMLAQDDVIGVMVLEETEQARGSLQRRLEIVSGIANQAAAAVQNCRLQTEMARRIRLEQELDLARQIQQDLMPTELPTPNGWQVAAICRPARQVGGDFYDVFELPEGRLGLTIADVADKGMPAALFMALTRALIRTIAALEASPAAVLSRVNELMEPDARQGMFVTAIYAVLSPERGLLTYANAGHPRPLLRRAATAQIERLEKGEIALGVLAGPARSEHTVELGLGDCLVMSTDGVTETWSQDADQLYGDERLARLVAEAVNCTAAEVVEEIVASVEAFAGLGALPDDLTVLVLARGADSLRD